MGKVTCAVCKKTCKEQALKLGDQHFHIKCFTCTECGKQLASDCFYTHNGGHYCSEDYLTLFGIKCRICRQIVEGEAITVLGITFHVDCFRCAACQRNLEPGDKVTFTESSGETVICANCSANSSSKTDSSTDCDDDWKPPTRQSAGSRCGSRCEVDYSRFYNTSYLDKSTDFKRGPSINPSQEKSPKHFHRPDNFSYTSVKRDFIVPAKRESSVLTVVGLSQDYQKSTGSINVLADYCCDSPVPPRTAKLDMYHPISKDEPIRLSKYPDAHRTSKQNWMDTSINASSGYQSNGEDLDQVDAAENDEAEGDVTEKLNPETYLSRSLDERDMQQTNNRFELMRATAAECDPTTGLKNTHLRSVYLCNGFVSPYCGRHRRPVTNLLEADKPTKTYPYEQLVITNLNLPPGVERQDVEKYLSDDDFDKLFHMSRDDFYRLVEWKRNDLKLKVGLF